MIKKFVVIGPESTGKSSLCQQLAAHYQTTWVPEFARQYLEDHGMNYQYDDLLTIARGQLALEEQHVQDAKGGIIFIDTDMYVMKVWCEFVFGKCHTWILDQASSRTYHGYLLCNVDLPWVKDALREYPDLENRKKLYHIYKDIMINQTVPWFDIRGTYDQRLQSAIHFVDSQYKMT